jgi:Ni/Co efflux regulator RcnB
MKPIVTAALVVSLLTGTAAMAGPHDNRDNGYSDRSYTHRDYRHGYRPESQGRYRAGEYQRPRGYYYRAWHRGDRLPPAWRSRHYIVHDYNVYRLRTPPRGYHWVRVDNDVVLAAVTTGVVLQVINNLFY